MKVIKLYSGAEDINKLEKHIDFLSSWNPEKPKAADINVLHQMVDEVSAMRFPNKRTDEIRLGLKNKLLEIIFALELKGA